VTERGEPIGVYADDLKEQSPGPQDISVKIAALNHVPEVPQTSEKHNQNPISEEYQTEQKQHLIDVPSIKGIELQQSKIDHDDARRFAQKDRKRTQHGVNLVLKPRFKRGFRIHIDHMKGVVFHLR